MLSCFSVPYAKTARLLIAMSIPGNILFIFAADYINMSTSTVSWVFVVSYLTASLVQVTDWDWKSLVAQKYVVMCLTNNSYGMTPKLAAII